jgi:ATP-dependent protease ClpP protease subunit
MDLPLDFDRTIFIDRDLAEDYEKLKSVYFELVKKSPTEWINLVVTTDGGSSANWFAFRRFIYQFSKTPLRTICLFKATSTGALIFMFGQERWMSKEASLFLHNGTRRTENTWDAKTFYEVAKELEFSDHCYRTTFLLSENIDPQKLGYEKLKCLMDEEKTLYSQEAFDLTIATKILDV